MGILLLNIIIGCNLYLIFYICSSEWIKEALDYVVCLLLALAVVSTHQENIGDDGVLEAGVGEGVYGRDGAGRHPV